MSKDERINIGTPENPIFVPAAALAENRKDRDDWWSSFASGSVWLTTEQLTALLQHIEDARKKV